MKHLIIYGLLRSMVVSAVKPPLQGRWNRPAAEVSTAPGRPMAIVAVRDEARERDVAAMIDDDRSGEPQRAGNHGMQRPDNRPWPEGRRLLLGFGLANGLMVVGVTLATDALLPLLPFLLLSIGAIGLPVVETLVVRLAASTTARRGRGSGRGSRPSASHRLTASHCRRSCRSIASRRRCAGTGSSTR